MSFSKSDKEQLIGTRIFLYQIIFLLKFLIAFCVDKSNCEQWTNNLEGVCETAKKSQIRAKIILYWSNHFFEISWDFSFFLFFLEVYPPCVKFWSSYLLLFWRNRPSKSDSLARMIFFWVVNLKICWKTFIILYKKFNYSTIYKKKNSLLFGKQMQLINDWRMRFELKSKYGGSDYKYKNVCIHNFSC